MIAAEKQIADQQAPRAPARAWAALGVAVLAVGSGSIFVRYAAAPALAKAAWRMGLAAALVLPPALWLARAELRRLRAGQWGLAALAGGLLALHFATWIASLDYTSVVASTLLVNTMPVWVALLAPRITGDRLGRLGGLGVGLSLCGMAALGAGEYSLSARALWGDALALAGGLAAAGYLMLGRRLRREVGLLTYLAAAYTIAAALLWGAVGLTGTRAWGFGAGTWAALAGMGLGSQHLGHSSYNYALRWISPTVLAVLLLSEPLLAGLAAWGLLGEIPSLRLVAAGLLLLPGIALVATDRAEK